MSGKNTIIGWIPKREKGNDKPEWDSGCINPKPIQKPMFKPVCAHLPIVRCPYCNPDIRF